VVCKTDRQSLVRLVKCAETGLRQHVCKGRMCSASQTNQVGRQDPIRAFGYKSQILSVKNDRAGICHLFLKISGFIVVQCSSNFLVMEPC
jgi:hypothetical protein